MTTITFRYQDRATVVYQNDAFVKAYSDYPDELTKIIRELEILSCNLSIATAPWDGTQRVMSAVTIGYRGKKLQFDFYHSLNDTEEWGISRFDSNFLKDVLHKLLHSIRSDVNIYEFGYEEFLDNYGQDSDIMKTYNVYLQCLAFSREIALVFNDEEIESFPY